MRTNYFGTSGADSFTATQTIRETFYGYEGDDVFDFDHGGNVFWYGDFSDRFIGGADNDRLQNLDINFLGDFSYDDYALASFDGGRGYDTVAFEITSDMAALSRASISLELPKFLTSSRSVEHFEYAVGLKIENNDLTRVTIDGGDVDETVLLALDSTNYADAFINVSLNGGNDRFEFSAHAAIESYLNVKTGAGKDVVIINAAQGVGFDTTSVRINTGNKSDVIVLEGMNGEFVNAGAGNDEIYVVTGAFKDSPDTILTGKGADRVYLELDEYSKIAKFRDFDAANDTIVFDINEFRDTTVTFDSAVAEASEDPMLFMNNENGKLYFGNNVMASFRGPTELTEANFVTDTWDYFSTIV